MPETLKSFNQVTGLEFCLKNFHPHLAVGTSLARMGKDFGLHLSPFCKKVKRLHNEKCRQCDLRDVPARCDREKKTFIHTCHAGASEVIIPVFEGGSLASVAYVGQFRLNKKQPDSLPLKKASERDRLMALANILQAYLSQGLRTPVFLQSGSKDYRKENILQFLRGGLKKNPALNDLATHLGLSASRAGHAVREATGSSFVQLRDGIRLERAKDLLKNSYYKVYDISAECGFTSPEYFHRFFREKTGTTPLEFRSRSRTEA